MAKKTKKDEGDAPDAITTRLISLHADERAKRSAKLAKEVVALQVLELDVKEQKRKLTAKVNDQKAIVQKLAREVTTGTEVVDAQKEMFDE